MSVCGAYKLNKQVDFLTKLSVKVVEAKIHETPKLNNSHGTSIFFTVLIHPLTIIIIIFSVYCAVKTSFQEFSTIKKYKTGNPIWNESFILYVCWPI